MRPLANLGAMVVAALLVLAPAAGAATKTDTASGGGITAAFTYAKDRQGYLSAQRLQILRGASVLYSAAVTDPDCGKSCGVFSTGQVLHVEALETAGVPDVVLDLYTGGAHCCTVEQVYAPAGGAYVLSARHNFGDPGDTIKDLAHDGRREFLSADDRFAYAFTDYAASGLPIQIWSYSAGRFHDVTSRFPHQIAADAATWLRDFKSQRGTRYQDSTGVIAAWAADEDRLGKHVAVDRYLEAQAKAGHLNSGLGKFEPSGSHYLTVLHRFLKKYGYLR